MILIVGLGNPGEKYQNSRHNLGYMVLDALLQDLMPVTKTRWRLNKQADCLVAKAGELILAKPRTMMNASGFAVSKLAGYYRITTENIWVVHDDLDLPLGKVKIKTGGGSAGHRGLESVAVQLGSRDFIRFRLGIGHPKKSLLFKLSSRGPVDKYVLSAFKRREVKEVRKLLKKAVEAINLAFKEGLDRAQNEFH